MPPALSTFGVALRGRRQTRSLSEVRAGADLPPLRDRTAVVVLHSLRAPHLPDGRDDLPQVLNVLALVVLRDVSRDYTRCGISAKQLERSLGVSYRTAWRMLNKIRNELMTDDGKQLHRDVEVDEASVDGKPRKKQGPPIKTPNTRSEAAIRERSRATVFAAVERGGKIKAAVLSPAGDRDSRSRSSSGSTRSRSSTPMTGPRTTAYTNISRRIAGSTTPPATTCSATRTRTPWRVSLATRSRRSRAPTEGVPPLAAGLPKRVHVALQPALPARTVDVRRTRRARRASRGQAVSERKALEALRRAAARREAADDQRTPRPPSCVSACRTLTRRASLDSDCSGGWSVSAGRLRSWCNLLNHAKEVIARRDRDYQWLAILCRDRLSRLRFVFVSHLERG